MQYTSEDGAGYYLRYGTSSSITGIKMKDGYRHSGISFFESERVSAVGHCPHGSTGLLAACLPGNVLRRIIIKMRVLGACKLYICGCLR